MSVRLEAIAQCDAKVEVLHFGQACVYAHGFFIEIVEVVAETVAVHVGQAPVAADDEVVVFVVFCTYAEAETCIPALEGLLGEAVILEGFVGEF